MKKAAVLVCIFVLAIVPSCKKKEKFNEPQVILGKWSLATERLDYNEYRKCEAYPKEREVFREIYRAFYFTDIKVVKIEDLDDKDVHRDPDGGTFVRRNVIFEGLQVRRSDRKAQNLVRGEVFFIRFIEGERKKEGWLMANRTITYLPR